MSKLQLLNGDDHPEAAGKHLADAEVLLAGARADGTMYLSGYVVECALKVLLLHEKGVPAAGAAPHWKKGAAGHDLHKLHADIATLAVVSGAKMARYVGATINKLPTLGFLPALAKTDDARPLVERMVGINMGAGIKKGLTFRWVLDHIRDGRGHALPRPLVRLFEVAATLQNQGNSHPRWPRLLEPSALRRALDKVSDEHVGSALDEWPWLEGLKSRLMLLREVPWERREIDRHLDRQMDGSWGTTEARPPVDSGRDLVEFLVEVGIFRARADGRIDAPDLFLAGLAGC